MTESTWDRIEKLFETACDLQAGERERFLDDACGEDYELRHEVVSLLKAHEAHEAGVRLKVCTPTLELWGEEIIPEIEETVGGAYLISEAMDDRTVTFTY